MTFDGGSVLTEAHGAEGVCANGVRGVRLASCTLMQVRPFMVCACTCAFTASLVFGDSRTFVVLAPQVDSRQSELVVWVGKVRV